MPEGVKWSTVGPGEDAHAIAKKLGATRLYNQSKLVRVYLNSRSFPDALFFLQGNILFSNELARRYGSEGIVSTSLHPGAINTELSRNTGSLTQRFQRLMSYDVSYGAITPLYAGTAPAAGGLNGKVGRHA